MTQPVPSLPAAPLSDVFQVVLSDLTEALKSSAIARAAWAKSELEKAVLQEQVAALQQQRAAAVVAKVEVTDHAD